MIVKSRMHCVRLRRRLDSCDSKRNSFQAKNNSMKFEEIYKKIISKEPYNDMNIFTCRYESFEEVPVVSRYSRLDTFKKELGCDGVRDMLITLSIFIINSALIVSRCKNIEATLLAITFTSFDRYEQDGFLIPKIFIYPKGYKRGFLKSLRQRSPASSQELQIIRQLFETNRAAEGFEFLESRFHDPACNEELVRIYAIPKEGCK